MGWIQVPVLTSIICFVFVSCVPPVPLPTDVTEQHSVSSQELLGKKECTYGPSYWCQNFTTSRSCGATKHCIQTVWEHQVLPVDDNDICKVCKDMVKQARDQLRSNETQELLKEVFEGSCRLIHIKEVVKECCKMADEFIPELIEALSSQMNPQVVCSVAGLCNSARIDKLLAKLKVTNVEVATQQSTPGIDCDSCYSVAQLAETKFRSADKDDVIYALIEMCGRSGSFSDGCAALVITHFQTLYNTLNERLNPQTVCHLAGVCSTKFHVHEDRNETSVTSSTNKPVNDDMACEMCEQLIHHLRDVLIANTSMNEFEQVLKGLCHQMGNFKEECTEIVEEYYPIIYNFLLSELDGKTVCTDIGLCKRAALLGDSNEKPPLWPLMPTELAEKVVEGKITPKLHRVKLTGTGVSVHAVPSSAPSSLPELMQLPIERLMPQSILPRNKEMCQMCELFLHYVQVEITDPSSEKQIKQIVKQACERLPQSVRNQCDSFVDVYGDAFIAILAQQIDPSQVCPAIGVCPGEALSSEGVGNKPNCPLCLMAAEFLVDKIKDNKTEADIRNALDSVCLELPSKLREDCLTFVTKFSEDLIDMIIADFTPEEICVYAKLCDPPPHAPNDDISYESSEETFIGGDILTNEIPQLDNKKIPQLDNKNKNIGDLPTCELCKLVLHEIDRLLKDNATMEEIIEAVEHVCIVVPHERRPQCHTFIKKYSDTIMRLLVTTKPSLVCMVMKLCLMDEGGDNVQLLLKKSVNRCIICESVMGALQGILEDDKIDAAINVKLEMACMKLPKSVQTTCSGLVEQLAPQIETIIAEIPAGPMVCRKLFICNGRKQDVHLIGKEECTWGPSFWCETTTNAAACGAIKHCQEKVWMGDKPKKMKN